jgi:hypothetical protein
MSVDIKPVSFRFSDHDKALLEGISRYFSDASQTAILRRLIRQEALRIGVAQTDDASKPTERDPQPEPIQA